MPVYIYYFNFFIKIFSLSIFLSYTSLIYPQAVSEGLIAYYPLNGDAIDYSENSYNGEVIGCLGIDNQNGDPNSALWFDGIDDYIYIPTDSNFQLNYPISFSAWVWSSKDTNVIFSNDYLDNNYTGIHFVITPSGQASVSIGDGSGIGPLSRRGSKTLISIPHDQWTHIVWIMEDTTDMQIYVNNDRVNIEYTGFADSLVYASEFATIGKIDTDLYGPPKYFMGKMDELYYFNRSLTKDDVSKLYFDIMTNYEANEKSIPQRITLMQNYPNPFNPSTVIEFGLPIQSNVSISIYDNIGQRIIKSEDHQYSAGYHSFEVIMSTLPSGIYYYKFQVGEYTKFGKMVLMK